MTTSLIANTGIQFFTSTFEVKAEDSFVDAQGNFLCPVSIKDENGFDMPLVFHERYNIIENLWTLDLAVNFSGGQIVRLEELRKHRPVSYLFTNPTGEECIVDENRIDFDTLSLIDEKECYSDYCFAGSITEHLAKGECPLDCIENQWLPMPMFEKDSGGNSQFGPTGWCRMKLVPVSRVKNVRRYNVIWAFDTTSVMNDDSTVRPFFYDGESEKKFAIADDVSLLFNFFSPKPYNCEWVDDYLAGLIHGSKENSELTNAEGESTHFRYIAYYITILSYLKKIGLTPEVILYTSDEEPKNVDLVLDIGNSRTCGVLFEDADFTKVDMLQMQDLSEPWKVYPKPFDMRVAFHNCKFGEMDLPDQFAWQSFLRVGDEAIKLIYKSRPANGVAQRTTNYSSPKRYLWDNTKFDGQWDFLTTEDDANSTLNHYIYIKGLSEQFDSDGSLRKTRNGEINSSFSRRSLMTFVMIEIFQQANCQINSEKYREEHGEVNLPRRLRNILITCPTAMPKEEQVILRQCAEDAYIALLRSKDPDLYYEPFNSAEWEGKIQIIPSVKDLNINPNNPATKRIKTEWGYDEATCCQLVYLYAEVAQRYLNHCEAFFNLYGHKRPELLEEEYDRKALTIGSIDIGAGTTDVMICSYKYDDKGVCKLTPKPLYWDSFYYAGDDLLEEIVRAIIIEGDNKELGNPNEGSIFNAVCASYMALNDEDFLEALHLKGKVNFHNLTDAEKEDAKYTYASRETSERIHNFFGKDKALMDYKDRLMRQDFNVQISVPMGLKMLDMLRLESKPSRLTYHDFFPELEPASFIIEHFNKHFSLKSGKKTYVDIDFRKIEWNFDPEELSKIIITKIDPLMKQLAVVLNVYKCDIVLLAGKPTSLKAITDLFFKYYPVSPNRLIRLNDYRVGEWYPFADGLGYFKDQKSLVAIGAMIGYLSSNGGMSGFHMDMSSMKREMSSTANYMGLYNSVNHKISEIILSPDDNSATFEVHGFPLFIGCKQLVSRFYQARPIYSLSLDPDVDPKTVSLPLKVSIVRNYSQDKENLKIVSVVDSMGKPFSISKLQFRVQSLANEGTYWLDKGEFVLSINS
ncbi:MAG: virulence factor SrfB [Bacteroidales bacterium]|nr:virulence factor SrfB [Bacteroidales bacterium]